MYYADAWWFSSYVLIKFMYWVCDWFVVCNQLLHSGVFVFYLKLLLNKIRLIKIDFLCLCYTSMATYDKKSFGSIYVNNPILIVFQERLNVDYSCWKVSFGMLEYLCLIFKFAYRRRKQACRKTVYLKEKNGFDKCSSRDDLWRIKELDLSLLIECWRV